MKNFTLLFLGLSFLGIPMANAQKKEPSGSAAIRRCGTMEAFEQRLQQDASFRAQWEEKQRQTARVAPKTGITAREANLTAPVNIPVIVHVVLPNPTLITEAQVDALLNQLNLDFSGLNPDSTNGAPYYGVRGHSQIRFVRARRDPNGNLTNGIERRVGNPGIATTTYQKIKHFSDGGLDPWDVTKYYNMWVGDAGSTGLLGIAPGIGVGGQTETTGSSTGIDGVAVDYRGFSNGCFSYPEFNRGRTVVHEIGHNFGLYHTFQGGCGNADFNQLTPAGQVLPAVHLNGSDDTPAQANATSGCPTGSPASGCSGGTTMYQNYMDYTDDACYSMFTKAQVARMEYVLENFRPGYLTTNGATPPSNVPALDITPAVLVSPGGNDFNSATCASISYPTPTCAGAIIPRVQIRNLGSSTLTSLTVSVSVNGGTPVSTTVNSLNVLTGYSTTVALPSVNLIEGANTLTFTTSAPNGGTDEVPGNNTFTTTVTISSAIALPITEGFESATFPPANWALNNPEGDVSWVRRAPGRNSGFSAFFDNWNNDVVGTKDDLRTLPIAIQNKAVSITFDVAHKNYGATTPTSYDTLQVLVSTDCGLTFTSLYKKWGTNLATAGTSNSNYTNPAAGDWRRDTVTVPASLLTSGKMIVAFRNSNRYGNNIFLDNINIAAIENRDIQAVSLNTQAPFVCTPTGDASITVRNSGNETITGFKVGYSVNGAAAVTQTVTGITLPKDAVIEVPITGIALGQGNNNVRAFTFDPVSATGTGDFNNVNDTVSKLLTQSPKLVDSLRENFSTGTTMPPNGWALGNYDNGATWTYSPLGNGNQGSAFLRTFNYSGSNNRDELVTPIVTYSGADSITLSFDVAAATRFYPGSTSILLDTLEVLATTNCGASYETVYKKWGSALQTLGTQGNQNFPQTTEFTPGATSWRTERIDATRFINNPSVQFVFRARSNNGNNIYIDNVNVTARRLPANLKQNGYVISPNPSNGPIRIWHVQPPTTLRFVNVYDSKGALVWTRSFTKNAENVIYVDLSGQPAGTYMVSLGYEDEYRNVTERVIKR